MSPSERPLAVITGASSGIGAEFARQLAARGYNLVLAARREDRLAGVAREIAAATGVDVETIAVDLATDSGRELLAARIRTDPAFALLVNNAGFGTFGFFAEVDLASQEQMHRLHVLATMALCHAALENLTKCRSAAVFEQNRPARRPRGIINVSSVAAFGQAPSNVSYCATKAWMSSFTNGLATELAMRRLPVVVQALCPGFTYSEFHDLLRMDRSTVPRSFWMSAEFVVAESLRGFERGYLIVVPGWRYKMAVAFMRVVPASVLRWFSIRLARRRRTVQVAANERK
jgi:short-subunit dehydrogenase